MGQPAMPSSSSAFASAFPNMPNVTATTGLGGAGMGDESREAQLHIGQRFHGSESFIDVPYPASIPLSTLQFAAEHSINNGPLAVVQPTTQPLQHIREIQQSLDIVDVEPEITTTRKPRDVPQTFNSGIAYVQLTPLQRGIPPPSAVTTASNLPTL